MNALVMLFPEQAVMDVRGPFGTATVLKASSRIGRLTHASPTSPGAGLPLNALVMLFPEQAVMDARGPFGTATVLKASSMIGKLRLANRPPLPARATWRCRMNFPTLTQTLRL